MKGFPVTHMYRRSWLFLSALFTITLLSACQTPLSSELSERTGTPKNRISTQAATFGDMTTLNALDLANTLVGAGVSVASATYTGANSAGGTFVFTGADDVLGFGSGVILSSGKVQDVQGPNQSGSTTTSHGLSGDPDLTALVSVNTFDAAVLEFTFVPNADKIFFQYVFGSEEYNEYVGSSFNDVFGFFVNGVNCAVVGDPPVPVSINSINSGSNSSLYVNNATSVISTEMDGFTAVLTCEAAVTPNVPNTLKLAIADGADSALDSWVLIRQGSLTTNPPGPDPEPGDQGCSPGFWRNRAVTIGAWAEAGYASSTTLGATFDLSMVSSLGSRTLMQALAFQGGSGVRGAAQILLRASVAALLNAAHPEVAYPMSEAEVLSAVNAALTRQSGESDGAWRSRMLALATQLDGYNNLGCPLGD